MQPPRESPTNPFVPFRSEEIEQSIPGRFEQQVAKGPERLAVKTRTQALTYAELNRAGNRIAHALLALRGSRGEPVALVVERDAPLIATILGVLKAGKICVPLDPLFPATRLAAMLQDSETTLLATNTRNLPLVRTVSQSSHQVINIDELDDGPSLGDPGVPLSADTLAYILYTSGSTGHPKGVIYNHRNLLHFIASYTNCIHICADDRLTQLYSCSVIGGVRDTFSALLNGAALFSFDIREEGLAPLPTWLMRENITIYHSVVSVFRHFVSTLTGQEAFPAVRLVFVGGEPVTRRDVDLYKAHFASECLLYVGLAATETGSISQVLMNKATQIPGGRVPLGFPVQDKDVLVVDEAGREVEVNGIGEIAVKSRYLALGYWGKPALTRTAFLPAPDETDVRIYRTGDLGLRRPDGCLEHHGRKDFQVKIRGHRVEVAEIEFALMEHAAIKEAVVVARGDQSGNLCLVAYMVPATTPAPSVGEVRRFVQARLPAYMVPAVFVWMEALPLTPLGKVDRQALPGPDRARPSLETPMLAPRTPLEAELARIWADVLDLEQVGIEDDFLELGGNSLLATQIVARVRAIFQVEIPLRELLGASTVVRMAQLIDQQWLVVSG